MIFEKNIDNPMTYDIMSLQGLFYVLVQSLLSSLVQT